MEITDSHNKQPTWNLMDDELGWPINPCISPSFQGVLQSQARAQVVSLPASPYLPLQVSPTPSGTVQLQAQGSGSWLGTHAAMLIPPHSLFFPPYRWCWEAQEKIPPLTVNTCSSPDKHYPQIQAPTLSQGSSLTFEHVYKKTQSKTSKLLQTEVSVSKYLWNTICSILFSKDSLHLLNANWSKNLSAIIPHDTSISTHTFVHRYHFPLRATCKDKNLYALTL